MQPVLHASGRSHPPAFETAPAALGQDRGGVAPPRRREVGEADRAQPDVERARLGDLQRRRHQVGSLVEQRPHLGGRLQPPLRVAARHVGPVDRDELAHALERVGQERVLRDEVPDRVGRDRSELGALGQPEECADLPVGVLLEPVLHGDERALAERLPVRHRRATTGVDPPRERERARRRGRPEESDETLRVRADLLGGERGVAALPRHVRVGDQPAQVRVPGRSRAEVAERSRPRAFARSVATARSPPPER